MNGNGQDANMQSETRVRPSTDALNLKFQDAVPSERLEQIWAHRAEQLAQVVAQESEGEQIELALVRLGREVYGLDVQYVFDIRPVEPHSLTRVPRTPEWVAGVVNLRGRILSVIDLQRFLGLLPVENADQSTATRCLVVVETPEMALALLADEALPMETVPALRIQDATSTVRGIRPEYMRGIAERQGGDPMVILDLPALLADKQLIVHEEIV